MITNAHNGASKYWRLDVSIAVVVHPGLKIWMIGLLYVSRGHAGNLVTRVVVRAYEVLYYIDRQYYSAVAYVCQQALLFNAVEAFGNCGLLVSFARKIVNVLTLCELSNQMLRNSFFLVGV